MVDNLFKDGSINKSQIQIVWKTPPFADYVWAAQADLPKQVKENIVNAFISLSMENKEGQNILNKTGANAYLPARQQDFSVLARVVKQQGLLE